MAALILSCVIVVRKGVVKALFDCMISRDIRLVSFCLFEFSGDEAITRNLYPCMEKLPDRVL